MCAVEADRLTFEPDIVLRSIGESDFAVIAEIRADSALQHCLLAHPHDRAQNDTLEWVKRRSNDGHLWIIAGVHDDRCIGFIQMNRQHFIDRYAYFGVAIVPREQGKGYGRQAVLCLTQIAQHELVLNKLMLEVRADNATAIALYKNLGFQKVGEFFQHYYDGVNWYDVVVMEQLLPASARL